MHAPHHFYYLHNFQQALGWIAGRYADLLSPEEQQFLQRFAALPQPSQALLVRMLMRNGPWFRASRLSYAEIPDLPAAARPLVELGWLDAGQPMALAELFALHTKPQLLQIFAPLGLSASLRKAELQQAVAAQHPLPQPYAAWAPGSAEPVWRVMVGPLCERLRLMFFGNLHQDWSEFVLADLGIFHYETVPMPLSSRAFQARGDVDLYLQLHACRQAIDAEHDTEQLLQTLAACTSPNPWLEKRRAKILLRIGQACERRQDWTLAQQVYAGCHYPGARHRRIRVLERLACWAPALALAEQALARPESEEELQRVSRMLPRLYRGLGRSGPGRPTAAPAVSRLDLQLPPATQSVEYAVRDHLQRTEAPVHYVENSLLNGLFGLLCWPAIFAPLPGAFFHPFQRGPADLHAPDFALRRQAEFAACLAALDDGRYRQLIRQRYADKAGRQNPFVHWAALPEERLELALACIPAQHLRHFFARMLADLQANRTGFPDLIRFLPEQASYELIEVKGPGDRLQDNQVRWMAYCLAQSIPVQVCYVTWEEQPA